MVGKVRGARVGRLIVGTLVALLVWWFRPTPIEQRPPLPETRPTVEAARPRRGFSSAAELQEHFVKHGAEFPGTTADTYLQLAQELRDAPLSETILEHRQRDGDFARFDRLSAAFVVFDTTGTIRTFFRPRDGERYYRRQLRRTKP